MTMQQIHELWKFWHLWYECTLVNLQASSYITPPKESVFSSMEIQ